MIKTLSTTLVGASIVFLSVAARADNPPCAAFQKLPNGNWNVVKAVTAPAIRALREWRTSLSAALTPEARAAAEKSLVDLAANAPAGRPTAMEIFSTLGEALNHIKDPGQSTQIKSLIVDYVAEIVELWRQVGLRPERAYSESDPTYFSRFHWFADDVLATVTDKRRKKPNIVQQEDLKAALRGRVDDDEQLKKPA